MAASAASLAQVHKAKYQGQDVAVKVSLIYLSINLYIHRSLSLGQLDLYRSHLF